MTFLSENTDAILWAFATTLILFLLSAVGSLIGGTILVSMRVGPVALLRRAASAYVTLVRNTPLVVMFMIVVFAWPIIGLNFNFVDADFGKVNLNDTFAGAVVACTLYTSSFVCEALRSGVNAVPLGQAEAARSIGLSFGGVMREVILPQAFKASIPPMASVQIALLKNTSVAAAFGVAEAVAQMKILTNNYSSQAFIIFFVFAAFYVLLVEPISFVANRYERKAKVA